MVQMILSHKQSLLIVDDVAEHYALLLFACKPQCCMNTFIYHKTLSLWTDVVCRNHINFQDRVQFEIELNCEVFFLMNLKNNLKQTKKGSA